MAPKIKEENLIHVKLESTEAKTAKRDLLSSQLGILKIAKNIKRHRLLRMEEFGLKTQLKRKLKELEGSIGKIQVTLPKLKIPRVLKEEKEEIKEIGIKFKEDREDVNLESQLQDIQRELAKIG